MGGSDCRDRERRDRDRALLKADRCQYVCIIYIISNAERQSQMWTVVIKLQDNDFYILINNVINAAADT